MTVTTFAVLVKNQRLQDVANALKRVYPVTRKTISFEVGGECVAIIVVFLLLLCTKHFSKLVKASVDFLGKEISPGYGLAAIGLLC